MRQAGELLPVPDAAAAPERLRPEEAGPAAAVGEPIERRGAEPPLEEGLPPLGPRLPAPPPPWYTECALPRGIGTSVVPGTPDEMPVNSARR